MVFEKVLGENHAKSPWSIQATWYREFRVLNAVGRGLWNAKTYAHRAQKPIAIRWGMGGYLVRILRSHNPTTLRFALVEKNWFTIRLPFDNYFRALLQGVMGYMTLE